MELLLSLALNGFFNGLLDDIDEGELLDQLGNLFDDGLEAGIDLFDDIDAAALFDELDDLNLLGGVRDLIDDVFDDTEEFADSDFFEDLVGRDIIEGTRRDDRLRGTTGDDILSGGNGNDTLLGLRGDDILIGGRGNDRANGQAGNDILSGLAGDDILSGGNGRDTLAGGNGLDTLTGGNGRDVFVLEARNGLDTLTDFRDGVDRLSLLDGRTFADLTLTQQGANAQISLNNTAIAQLNGVQVSQITAADFTTLTLT